MWDLVFKTALRTVNNALRSDYKSITFRKNLENFGKVHFVSNAQVKSVEDTLWRNGEVGVAGDFICLYGSHPLTTPIEVNIPYKDAKLMRYDVGDGTERVDIIFGGLLELSFAAGNGSRFIKATNN